METTEKTNSENKKKRFIRIDVSSEQINNDKLIYLEIKWHEFNINHQIIATYSASDLINLYNQNKQNFMMYQVNYLNKQVASSVIKEQIIMSKSLIKHLIQKELGIKEN